MRVAIWPTTFMLATAVTLAGCGGDDGGGDELAETSSGEEEQDTETSDSGGEGLWEFEDVIGVSNGDDDDETGKRDWLKPPFDGDDDILNWTMPSAAFDGFVDGHTAELLISGDSLEVVRFWHNGAPALGHDVPDLHDSYSFTPSGGDEAFQVEFDDYNKVYTLVLNHLDADGAVVESAEIMVRSAPLIMNHHLQPAEFVWAVSVGSNPAFIQSYQDNIGGKFSAVLGSTVGSDVWIQDEIEFATTTAPGTARANIIIDSIRDRGLNNFPDQIVQPNIYKRTWGIPGTESSADSFGNLEATPPITVGGVEYPFGRIYFGKVPQFGINDVLSDFLDDQSIQAPVHMDTAWLCVGHVDEFSSFVPDPSSPLGFKALLADSDAAYALLESLDPDTPLPRYDSDHGFATVGEIVNDPELRALNEELRDDQLAIIREQFKTEFNLTDADIIPIPNLFEPVSGCGGGVVSLMPGMVNLIVANFEGETPKLFIPDPFFRTNLNDQSGDPLIDAFTDAMPDGLESIYVDNWTTYHMALGEVHCGTNVMRTPIANWWEVAGHLLD